MFDFIIKPVAATLVVLLTTTAVPAQDQAQPDEGAAEAVTEAPSEAASPVVPEADTVPENAEATPEEAGAAPGAAETGPDTAEAAPVAPEEPQPDDAAPAETAATCSAMQVLEDGIPAARRTATLAEDGLATHLNVHRAHDNLADAVSDELEQGEYETACINSLLTLAVADASPQIDGVNPDLVTDAIVGVWVDKCEEITAADDVIACFTDLKVAAEAELLTDQQKYRLTKALPLGDVDFDDAELTTLLEAIKSAVEDGTISSAQQTDMVNELLGQ